MTERQSPPTERVVRVLNLLGEHPDRRLTLTEVTDRLGLSKPTCLGILAALAEAGFVTRDAGKRYGLGPALLRLGWAAESGAASLDLVRPHVRALHERLGLACVLAAVHGDQLVVVDRLGRLGPGDRRDLVGERFPCVPPLGLTNVAWGSDEDVREWLARPSLVPIAAPERQTWDLIREARGRGFLIERLTGADAGPNIVLANLEISGLAGPVREQLRRHLPPADWAEYGTGLPEDPDAPVPVACLSAPIHDRHGRQCHTVTVLANRSRVPAAECRHWIDQLLAATRAATEAVGGVRPTFA